jgi:predicted amidohydrolase
MQQVSVTAREGDKETVGKRWHDRAIALPGTNIGFLICGESWSDELLDRVAKSGCRTLVVAAHRNVNLHREKSGYGKLSWHRRLGAFSRQHRLPTVVAEHTRSPDRHPYAWPAAMSRSLQLGGLPDEVTLRIAEV